ncbi:MAG: HDIG domain-containing protein [Clostridiales bacterium]|nr:HDIG domain-containing protein [Clostridiales bacterium]
MTHRENNSKKKQRGKLLRFLRSPQALRLMICLIGTAIMVALFEIAIVPVRYDLKVGMIPTHTIAATRDVADEVTTDQQRAAAAAQVRPTYRYEEGVTEDVMADFDQIFAQLRAVRQYGATLPNPSPTRTYDKEELAYAREMLTLLSLRDYQISTLLRCSQEELDEGYSLLYAALQSIMQGRVIEGQEAQAVASIRQIVDYRMSISLGQNIVPAVLDACIQPNILIDHEATQAAREEARSQVEPVIIRQGQVIVERGSGKITEAQMKMLSSLGLISDGKLDLTTYGGAALLCLLMLGGLLLLLKYVDPHLYQDTARLLLLFVILIISLGVCILARLIDSYLMPTALCALLVTALLGMRPGLICNTALTVMAAALAAGGSEVYAEKMVIVMVAGLLGGTAGIVIIQNKVTRTRLLAAGVAASAVELAACIAMGLMTASDLSASLTSGVLRMGSALAAALLCIGIQPLLEMMFNLPTPMKLMELANPNQPLLKRLLLEAPGTYHHSTIVASLAEAAAEAIGANPLLARVGGYYHDIGKLKRPLYFKENQLGDQNAHDHTNPEVSAAIVTAHTRDGLAMAKGYRLPQAVQDIIYEHHGNTPVMFFYHKALQMAGGKPVDIDAYRYDGKPPRTKEGAIVLLCDTIEAAVRTMKNPTPDGIEDFIVKLVRGKLEDGQLSDSPLTLRDIDKICAAATTVLTGVFHERIEYPDVEPAAKKALTAELPPIREEAPPVPEAAPLIETPIPEMLPILELEKKQLAPLVVPEAAPIPLTVEPPVPITAVEIDQLVNLSPLPTKEEEAVLEEEKQNAAEAEENPLEAGDEPGEEAKE